VAGYQCKGSRLEEGCMIYRLELDMKYIRKLKAMIFTKP